ncbi:MAG: NF038129 family PEP-CTERM protein [Rhizobiales bacterium]|nr:NF038129 family PEP-CTERM protein [Hyphomicrobiales bacterium]
MKKFGVAAVLLAFAAVTATVPAKATTYTATIDTSGLFGSTVQFAWDLIGNGAQSNTVVISNFQTDGTIGPATNTGNVTGSMPGNVALSDAGSFFNEHLINLTLGNFLKFSFTPTNNFTGVQPTGFSGLFVDPNTNFQLFPTTDPSGADVLFLLTIDGITPGGHLDVYSAVGNEVTIAVAVPELSTWAMIIVGFGGIGFAALRRKSSLAMVAV